MAISVSFFFLWYGFVIYSAEHFNTIRDVTWSDPNLMRCNALLDCFRIDGQNLRQSLYERQRETGDSFSRLMFSTVRFHATSTWAAIVNWTIVGKILIQGMSKDDAIAAPWIYLEIQISDIRDVDSRYRPINIKFSVYIEYTYIIHTKPLFLFASYTTISASSIITMARTKGKKSLIFF
jgi:hypothetical protein